MITLFEYGQQIYVKDRKGLEEYLRFLWQDYKNLWVDENQESENINNSNYQPFISFDGEKEICWIALEKPRLI